MSAEKADVPQIHDKSQKPTGLFHNPRVQQWVYLAVSAAVVIPILLSGSKPRAPITASAASSPQPTPSQIIQQYQKDLGREQALLDQQKRQLEQAKPTDLRPPMPAGAGAPVTLGTLPGSSSERGVGGGRDRTLYASNVVDWRPASTESARPPFDGNRRLLPAPDAAALPEETPPVHGENSKRTKARPPYEERNRAEGKNHVLFEGTILEAVLKNRLDGYFSGPLSAVVATDVYSRDRVHLLVPKGTEVLGEVQKVDNFGQQRLAVFFHRVIMPDGYSLSLDQFKGLDQIGETGLQDLVNHHYVQIFGASLAIGAVSGLAQANTRYGLDASGWDVYRQGVSASLSQSATHILDRFLNVLPTITIREGQRIKIYLAGDLLVPDYDHHTMSDEL